MMMSDESIELPEGWECADLGELVLQISYGYTASATHNQTNSKFLRITDLQNNSVDWNTVPYCDCSDRDIAKYKLKRGDIVVARTGATTGKSFLLGELPETTVFASYLIRLKTSELSSTEYLALFMQSDDYWKQITTISKGTAQPGANASILSTLAIPIPPIAEQKRIVAKIEELRSRTQKAREALAAIPEMCDRFRQSVLAAAFRGDLTADWREENPDVEPAEVLVDKSNSNQAQLLEHLTLFDIPDKWWWSKVREIGTVSGGLTKNSKRDELPLEFPYLRVANVYFNQLDLSEIKTIRITESEYKRVLLEKGDLLVVEGNGSLDQIGRVALWDGSITPCLHQNHLIKVRFHFVSMGMYVLYWLLSEQGRDSITTIASSTSGLHTLSLSKVASLPVPVAPQQEQAEIVSQIQKLFQIIDLIYQQYEAAKARLEKLDRAILAKAFRGELVLQDPNDEPASVLLDRIREERAKISEGKPTKRKR